MQKVYKTITWKKIVIELQGYVEPFDFYFDDVKLYYNTMDYKEFWDLKKRQVEYLQWKCDDDEKDENLEKMKLENLIIWFDIIDYWSNGCRIRKTYENTCDGFLIFNKKASDNYINYVFDCLEKRWNWEVYCVWVYEPVYYKRLNFSIDWQYEYIKYREWIDSESGFFDFDEAKNSYEALVDDYECDYFTEYEFMSENEYIKEKYNSLPSKE